MLPSLPLIRNVRAIFTAHGPKPLKHLFYLLPSCSLPSVLKPNHSTSESTSLIPNVA